MYQPFKFGAGGRPTRGPRLLEFARPEDGRRVIPHLTLEPKEPEEVSFIGKYLELADQALHNRDLPNPASTRARRPKRRVA